MPSAVCSCTGLPARARASVNRGLTTPTALAVTVAPLARRYQMEDGDALVHQMLAEAA